MKNAHTHTDTHEKAPSEIGEAMQAQEPKTKNGPGRNDEISKNVAEK